MKPLQHHTLLYDTHCPLCAAYTKGFIRTGMLDENGRTSYEEGISRYGAYVDARRARNEIALLNTRDGSVIYGIDSLVAVLTHSCPPLRPVLSNALSRQLLQKLYALISFNRKVIAPSGNYTAQVCVPDFNLSYRIAFLLLALALICITAPRMLNGIPFPLTTGTAFITCVMSVGLQVMVLATTRPGQTLLFNYLGNLATLGLVTMLLLLPLCLLNRYVILPRPIPVSWLLAVMCCQFLLHRRRVRSIGAPVWLPYTWILFTGLAAIFSFLLCTRS